MELKTAVSRQRGFAALELAAWMAVLLPLALTFVALFGLVGDQQVVRLIPESLMREAIGRTLVWESNGINGDLRTEEDRLERMIGTLSLRGIAQLQDESLRVLDVSSRACYWVYNVDEVTGDVGNLVSQSCVAQGLRGNILDIDQALNRRLADGVARPITVSVGAGGGFFPRATLVGVAVGGRFEGLGELFREDTVEHAAVWVPREEVVL